MITPSAFLIGAMLGLVGGGVLFLPAFIAMRRRSQVTKEVTTANLFVLLIMLLCIETLHPWFLGLAAAGWIVGLIYAVFSAKQPEAVKSLS